MPPIGKPSRTVDVAEQVIHAASCRRIVGQVFAFDDRWGSDLHVWTMDFDASGHHLLYAVSSDDGRPVGIDDDRTVGSGQTGQHVTTAFPSW